MVSEVGISATSLRRLDAKESVGTRGPPGLDDEDLRSSAEPSELDSLDGIDPLLGARVTTSFGPGVIEEIREYEDMVYCNVRLQSFGSVSLAQAAIEALLRKERKLGPTQGIALPRSGSRYQNLKGSIRMYNPAKGWGFLRCEEFDGDVFLHSKHMAGHMPKEYIGHFQSHQGGHQVRFDLDLQHKNRPQALNVRVISGEEQEFSVNLKKRSVRGRPDQNDDQLEEFDEPGVADPPGACLQPPAEPSDPWAAAAAGLRITVATLPDADAAAGSVNGGEDEGYQYKEQDFILSVNLSCELVCQRAGKKGVVRMRGLPFTATPSDIAEFFSGYGVRPEDVIVGQRGDGSPSGEACAFFARDELAEKARKEKNMQHIGHRYIELFDAKGTSVAAYWRGDADDVEDSQLTGVESNAENRAPYALANPPAYSSAMPAAPGSATMAFDSSAVAAGAVPPSREAAAAAVAQAAHAAALHKSYGVHTPAAPPPLPSGVQRPAQADLSGGGALPQQGTAEQAAWAQQQYEHHFRYFQQAYAMAAASQAVQAYASAAAVQYQQQSPLLPQPGDMAEVPTNSLEQHQLQQATSFDVASEPPELASDLSPWLALGQAAERRRAAAGAAAVATPAAAPLTAVSAVPGGSTEAQAHTHSDYNHQTQIHPYSVGGAPGLDYSMGAPNLDPEVNAYVPQVHWQYYNMI